MRRWLAAAALFALACSSSTTLSHEQLESEQKQLRSLEAEVTLHETIVSNGRATQSYARGHARYLAQAAQEHITQLAKKTPAPGDEAEFRRLQAGFAALPPRLQ